MYRYDEFDHALVSERIAEFTDQVRRRVDGRLTEDQFKPLRLMNGVYLQLHAYMLRVAIPYGTLNSKQMRMLAEVARKYDRGYGHFTTRQNIQYNWPKLSDTPAILEDLASVEMHAIQTSGNCIRNVTADHFAGAAADEVADPRPYAEILRQWSSLHPEFSFLPRKFKIAVTGAEKDRAAIQVHDIGLHLKKNASGELGFAVALFPNGVFEPEGCFAQSLKTEDAGGADERVRQCHQLGIGRVEVTRGLPSGEQFLDLHQVSL